MDYFQEKNSMSHDVMQQEVNISTLFSKAFPIINYSFLFIMEENTLKYNSNRAWNV